MTVFRIAFWRSSVELAVLESGDSRLEVSRLEPEGSSGWCTVGGGVFFFFFFFFLFFLVGVSAAEEGNPGGDKEEVEVRAGGGGGAPFPPPEGTGTGTCAGLVAGDNPFIRWI